jgi:pimeloyl-ACP methyl ester carboxylesterase
VEKVSVIGHSMGGMLAVRWALANPMRTERLILVNPIGLEDWQLSVPYQTIDQAYHRELQSTRASIKAYMQASYTRGAWSAVYDEPLGVLAGWTEGPDRRLIAWERALVSDMIFTQPVVHEFPALRVPTLLLIGQRDRTAIGKERAPPVVAARLGDYPALGRRAAKAIPHAKLVEIPLAGHLPQFDAFDAYIREVGAFLDGR